MKTRLEISAGGVIYRRLGETTEVCLISTQGGKAWQLPKGLIEPDEEPEVAAQREVQEETGLLGALVKPLDKIEYWYVWNEDAGPVRVHKYVDFFLFRYVSGSTDDHDHEVDEARWYPLEVAEKTLSFDGERRVMRQAAKEIEAEALA